MLWVHDESVDLFVLKVVSEVLEDTTSYLKVESLYVAL